MDQRSKYLLGYAAGFTAHVNEFWQSLALSRHSIGARLLAGVLLFSGSVTLVLTAIQLYLDYRREVSAIEVQLNPPQPQYSAH